MRIGIDARAASHPQRGGFKAYVEDLLSYLPQVDDQHEYIVYFDRAVGDGAAAIRSNFRFKVVKGTWPLVGMPLREQVTLPLQMRQDQVDLAHFPCATAPLNCPCPFVVTIHDVLGLLDIDKIGVSQLLHSPKRILMHLYYRYSQLSAARKAAAVITISHHSQEDIQKYLGVPTDKIAVIYRTPKGVFRPVDDVWMLKEIKYKYQLPGQFIMGMVSASPRKNARGLVEAYAQLGSDLIGQYQLAIVWTHGLFRGEIAHLVQRYGLERRVAFLDNVSDENLVHLYNAASLFVFPSFYEGFGLPPLEAMACGTPVVASNTSSIPEVLGDAAILISPHNAEEIAQAIRQVLTDEELSAALRQKGLERASLFSGERAARETVAVYQQAYQTYEGNRQ